jgi:hypothetical protein
MKANYSMSSWTFTLEPDQAKSWRLLAMEDWVEPELSSHVWLSVLVSHFEMPWNGCATITTNERLKRKSNARLSKRLQIRFEVLGIFDKKSR